VVVAVVMTVRVVMPVTRVIVIVVIVVVCGRHGPIMAVPPRAAKLEHRGRAGAA
jgi:hypothetical protein